METIYNEKGFGNPQTTMGHPTQNPQFMNGQPMVNGQPMNGQPVNPMGMYGQPNPNSMQQPMNGMPYGGQNAQSTGYTVNGNAPFEPNDPIPDETPTPSQPVDRKHRPRFADHFFSRKNPNDNK